jgi:hypothetical protein
MFTGRAEVDIRYAQFTGLGRTTNAALDDTQFNASGAVTHAGTNQRGRYPVYFNHLIGPAATPANGYQYTFQGNAVLCPMDPMPFKWGVALNDSHYGLIKDNVLYNWAGAGIVGENGNETANVLDHNYVVRISNAGGDEDLRGRNDVGHTGAGFWFRGSNNFIRNNVVSDATKGYVIAPYMAANPDGFHLPIAPGVDPNVAGQYRVVTLTNLPLLQFVNNEAGGAVGIGLELWKVNNSGRKAFPNAAESVVKDFKAWHVGKAYYNYMTAHVTFDGLVARNDFSVLYRGTGGGTAFFAGDYSQEDFKIINSNVQGFQTGILIGPLGNQTIENSFFRNHQDIVVEPIWSTGFDGRDLPSRTVVIRNVRFAALSRPTREDWGQQAFIVMKNRPADGTSEAMNMLANDEVYVYAYNGVANADYRLYYNEQRADAIVPQTTYRPDGTTVLINGAPVAGLTNQQSWEAYHIAFANAVAPSDATTVNGILGLAKRL